MKYSIFVISLLFAYGYATNLNQQCFNSAACVARNSTCEKQQVTMCPFGTCKCGNGYYPNSGGTECWQKQKFGGSCTAHVCLADDGLICSGSTCACLQYFTRSGSNDHCDPQSINLNSACTNDRNCQTPNAHCSGSGSKTCQCKPGFYLDGSDCKPALNIDASCEPNRCDTTKFLRCSGAGGTCICETAYRKKGGKCEPAQVGDTCDNSNLLCGVKMTCPAGATRQCTCEANHEWVDVNIGGNFGKRCIHKDAIINRPKNDICKEDNDNTGKFCREGLLCENCYPGNQNVCMEKFVATTAPPSVTDARTTPSAATSSMANISLLITGIISALLTALKK